MITTGAVVDERYRIDKVLGAGGFGCVYKAWHTQLDRPVAIKLLSSTVLEESDGAARFEREARAISQLKHKNIVSFYGFGIFEQSPYMVMEFVEGTSIQSLVSARKPVAIKRAIELIHQLCEALACAHAHGIVHRDLKPANVMIANIDGRECLKIIDFGLAKLMPGYGVPAQKLTEAGVAVGTCTYMSPEQCVGNLTVDQRTDIYAAGCLLYELLTGNSPYVADDNVALMFQHVNAPIPRLTAYLNTSREINALQAVVDKAMAKDPEDRYAAAEEMIADLDAVTTGKCDALADHGRQAKSTGTALYRAQSFRQLLPFALLVAAVTAAIITFFYSQAEKKQRANAVPMARILFDKMWVESNRIYTHPQRAAVAAQIALIDRTLEANRHENSLTAIQYLQLLREAGRMRVMSDEHEAAIPYFREVLQSATPDVDTFQDRNDLARAYEVTARLDDAEKELRTTVRNWTLEKSPTDSFYDAWIALGRVALKKGDVKAAQEALLHIPADKTLKRGVSCAYFFLMGHLMFIKGEPAYARAEYEAGLPTTGPDTDPGFQAAIARCALEMKKKEEYSKLLGTLQSYPLSQFLPNARSVGAMQIILAAEAGERQLVEDFANRLLKLKYAPVDEIHLINKWDADHVQAALRKGGYKKIEKKLERVFGWQQ